MIPPYQEIYEAMLQEILDCQGNRGGKLLEIECCFKVTSGYLNRLSQLAPIAKRVALCVMDTNGIGLGSCTEIAITGPSVDTVILFYKEIQPAFLSMKRYYELCFYAAVFRPTEIDDLALFCRRESNRASRYFEENLDLYEYYVQNRTDMDMDVFAGDPVDAARYGAILADFLALQRYSDYLVQMMSWPL